MLWYMAPAWASESVPCWRWVIWLGTLSCERRSVSPYTRSRFQPTGTDRAANTTYPAGTLTSTSIAVVVGVAAWLGFALWAHGVLIGVRPFG